MKPVNNSNGRRPAADATRRKILIISSEDKLNYCKMFSACLIPYLDALRDKLGVRLPKKIVADVAYGSEENYAYLEKHGAESFLKYNTFYQDTHHYHDPEVLRPPVPRGELRL